MSPPAPDVHALRGRRSTPGGTHHPARGQRRHRQDLRPRGAHRPIRRRAGHPDRQHPARDLHPGGDGRAARADPDPTGRGRRPTWTRAAPPARARTRCWPISPTSRRTSAPTRHALLERAVRDYDTATIVTIHGFCSQVRASLGVLAEQNPDAIPTQSEAQLIRQVASDLIFSRASAHADGGEGDGGPDDPAAVELPSLDDLCAAVAKARTLGECEVRAESGRDEDLLLVELVDTACDAARRTPPAHRRPVLRLAGGRGTRRRPRRPRPGRDAPRAVPRRAHRRVPGHRPGAVGPVPHGVRRRPDRTAGPTPSATAAPSSWSATPNRRSTPSAAATSTPTCWPGQPLTDSASGVNHRSDASVVDAMNALAEGQVVRRAGDRLRTRRRVATPP